MLSMGLRTQDTHYVDPAPFLVRSTIAEPPRSIAARPDRRHPIKPAI